MRVAVIGEDSFTDPRLACVFWGNPVLDLVYDSLYRSAPETGEILPWLAATEPRLSKDGRVITVRLRRNVLWHDLEPFDSSDVIYTFNEVYGQEVAGGAGSIPALMEYARAVDAYTVEFGVRNPAIFIRTVLTLPILPEHIWRDRGSGPVALTGTGPFIAGTSIAGSYLALRVNRNYFASGWPIEIGGRQRIVGPYLMGIVIRSYSDAALALNALVRGGVDLIVDDTGQVAGRDLQEPGIDVSWYALNELHFLAFNLASGPVGDIRVRQALAAAVRKEMLARRDVMPAAGVIPVFEFPGFSCLQVTQGGCADGLDRGDGTGSTARSCGLDSGSWTGTAGPGGLRHIEVLVPEKSDNRDLRQYLMGLVHDAWFSLGIETHFVILPLEEFVDRVYGKRDYAVAMLGWELRPGFPVHVLSFFRSSEIRDYGYNIFAYRNRTVDDIVEELLFARCFDDFRDAGSEFAGIIDRDIPWVPLGFRAGTQVVRRGVFEGTGSDLRVTVWPFLLANAGK